MRDEFRRELRARLMREAAVTLIPRRRENAWTTWLRPALAVGLAALVLIAGAGSAAGSVPGDATFGLKRAIEEVRVALTFDDVQRVGVLAEIADQRLSELEQVAGHDDKAPAASEEYARAVTRFRVAVDTLQQAAPGDKSTRAQDVADAARDKHEIAIEQLKERLSGKAKESVQRALKEERRDTPNTTKGRKVKDQEKVKNAAEDADKEESQGSAPRTNAATPRPGEHTNSPRPTERQRATPSPKPTDRD
jgi:hypothetical protein